MGESDFAYSVCNSISIGAAHPQQLISVSTHTLILA